MFGNMSSPEEFLRSFLRERDSAYAGINERLSAVHTKYFGEPLSKHASDFLLHERADAAFEVVHQLADSVVIVTSWPFRNHNIRERYHLAAMGAGWRISRIDRECFCHVWDASQRKSCPQCHGEGWYDPRSNKAEPGGAANAAPPHR